MLVLSKIKYCIPIIVLLAICVNLSSAIKSQALTLAETNNQQRVKSLLGNKNSMDARVEITLKKLQTIDKFNSLVNVKIITTGYKDNIFFVKSDIYLEQVIAGKDSLRQKKKKYSYWCPIDLVTGSTHPKNSNPEKIIINKQGIADFVIDLSKPFWGRSIDAVWPFQKLFQVVPCGQYTLFFNIVIEDSYGPKKIRSNELIVTVGETNRGLCR